MEYNNQPVILAYYKNTELTLVDIKNMKSQIQN